MAKMTLKRAKELYKKAHKNLTPSEEEAAHKAEKLLKKKKIEAERKDGNFTFTGKKDVKESKMLDRVRKAINAASYKLSDVIAPGLKHPLDPQHEEPAPIGYAIHDLINRAKGVTGDAVNKLRGKPTRKQLEDAEEAANLEALGKEFDELNRRQSNKKDKE